MQPNGPEFIEKKGVKIGQKWSKKGSKKGYKKSSKNGQKLVKNGQKCPFSLSKILGDSENQKSAKKPGREKRGQKWITPVTHFTL